VWVGAPMMVTAGLFGFARQWRTIVRAVRGILSKSGEEDELVARTEVPIKWFIVGAGTAGLGLVVVAWRAFSIPPHLGVLAVLMTFFLALSSRAERRARRTSRRRARWARSRSSPTAS
jgi:hypothetical protein